LENKESEKREARDALRDFLTSVVGEAAK